jgi:hypothetical protein
MPYRPDTKIGHIFGPLDDRPFYTPSWPGETVLVNHPDEIRVTDPVTGGQKGQKNCQMGGLPPDALQEVGRVSGFGATKYARYNYLKGYNWSLSYDALQRHLHAFWQGEDFDEESALLHLAHAAWHCLALIAFTLHGLGKDDRPYVN